MTHTTDDTRHRHTWTTTDDLAVFACSGCAEQTRACCDCGQPVGDNLDICANCLKRAARTLRDFDTATSHLAGGQKPATLIKATRYDRDIVHGTGSDEITPDPNRWDWHDAMDALNGWADAWEQASPIERRLRTIDYLISCHIWAATNRDVSGWADYRAESRKALAVAKREAGLMPRRMPAPCAWCGGVAIQTWADKELTPNTHGLSDEVTCTGCKRTWPNSAAYLDRAKWYVKTIPHVTPEMPVTAKEAATIWPDVPAGTWRRWASEGRLPDPAGFDERGVPMYFVKELAELVEHRASATRRGPKITPAA